MNAVSKTLKIIALCLLFILFGFMFLPAYNVSLTQTFVGETYQEDLTTNVTLLQMVKAKGATDEEIQEAYQDYIAKDAEIRAENISESEQIIKIKESKETQTFLMMILRNKDNLAYYDGMESDLKGNLIEETQVSISISVAFYAVALITLILLVCGLFCKSKILKIFIQIFVILLAVICIANLIGVGGMRISGALYTLRIYVPLLNYLGSAIVISIILLLLIASRYDKAFVSGELHSEEGRIKRKRLTIKNLLYAGSLGLVLLFCLSVFFPYLKVADVEKDRAGNKESIQISFYEFASTQLSRSDSDFFSDYIIEQRLEALYAGDFSTAREDTMIRAIMNRGNGDDEYHLMFLLSFFGSIGFTALALIFGLITLILAIFNWWNRAKGSRVLGIIALSFGILQVVCYNFFAYSLSKAPYMANKIVWTIPFNVYVTFIAGLIGVIGLFILIKRNKRSQVNVLNK